MLHLTQLTYRRWPYSEGCERFPISTYPTQYLLVNAHQLSIKNIYFANVTSQERLYMNETASSSVRGVYDGRTHLQTHTGHSPSSAISGVKKSWK